ncbi:unnamed protein product [Clavelina lepadiformis]|uniref:Uncharacterized protein n=1 Tax=Clavelina lepadiformis TaxID=159417 RepID=A0ABP0GE79_CLALP
MENGYMAPELERLTHFTTTHSLRSPASEHQLKPGTWSPGHGSADRQWTVFRIKRTLTSFVYSVRCSKTASQSTT